MEDSGREVRHKGSFRGRRAAAWLLAGMLCLVALCGALAAQNSSPEHFAGGSRLLAQTQAPPPAAGGPSDDLGQYAIPRSQPEQPSGSLPPPPPSPPADEKPAYSIHVDVPLVTLHVSVRTRDGEFIPGLHKEQFRVEEDHVPQTIQSFRRSQGNYTAVLLVEFAATPAFQLSRRQFLEDALRASYAFTQQMQKDDYVSVISYDMKPNIVVDFTRDKQQVLEALNSLRMPSFSQTNLFDALYDTLDRLERVDGRKEIILIGSGLDTFSRVNYDTLLKKIKATQNVTIYTISTGFLWRQFVESQPGLGASMITMDYLQADNQMSTFAQMTGGRWFSPRFQGELPEDFRAIASAVRDQYTLTYSPTNTKQDGSYRKVKVTLVQPGTDKPLIVRNERGKKLKYQVITRDGYTAKHAVE
jgi:VWFA-related protein